MRNNPKPSRTVCDNRNTVVLPPCAVHAAQPEAEYTASILNRLSTAMIIQMVRSPLNSAAIRLPSDIFVS